MRYIEKGRAPDFFAGETEQLSDESSCQALHCKPELRQHLMREQDHLCAYCERKLDDSNTHIEHIEPQSRHPEKRFDYGNLIASCDGGRACASVSEQSAYADLDTDSCGHRKGQEYDAGLFLNPTALPDVGDYFAFDTHSAKIKPSDAWASQKAAYTIDLLNLNSAYLCNARKNARGAFRKAGRNKLQPRLRSMLDQPQPFISYLRACYLPADRS